MTGILCFVISERLWYKNSMLGVLRHESLGIGVVGVVRRQRVPWVCLRPVWCVKSIAV